MSTVFSSTGVLKYWSTQVLKHSYCHILIGSWFTFESTQVIGRKNSDREPVEVAVATPNGVLPGSGLWNPAINFHRVTPMEVWAAIEILGRQISIGKD